MKEETLAKALDLCTEITQARGVVKVLKDNKSICISDCYCDEEYEILTGLKEKILPVCEEYLRELEKEFEEL